MKREDWNRRYAGRELIWSAEPNRFLVAEVEDLEPGRACDLACGEGRNAVWLASLGWRVTAVDFSDVAVEKGRRLAEERGLSVDFAVADLLEHQPTEAAYDLVIIFYLHIPWEQMRTVLGRAARAVAPGGVFLLVGHDIDNLDGGHGGPQDARVLYSPDAVAGELKGLRIERAERVIREVETEDGTARAIDNLVRARRDE